MLKRLTQAQLHERHTQRLCYYCVEKYVISHRCRAHKFLLLFVDDDELALVGKLTDMTCILIASEDPEEPQLHLYLFAQALTRVPSPQTLHFKRSINGQTMMILMDSKSSHNILQTRWANQLRLTLDPTLSFVVMVGNGDHLFCSGLYHVVPLVIQNQTFDTPMYLLPI